MKVRLGEEFGGDFVTPKRFEGRLRCGSGAIRCGLTSTRRRTESFRDVAVGRDLAGRDAEDAIVDLRRKSVYASLELNLYLRSTHLPLMSRNSLAGRQQEASALQTSGEVERGVLIGRLTSSRALGTRIRLSCTLRRADSGDLSNAESWHRRTAIRTL